MAESGNSQSQTNPADWKSFAKTGLKVSRVLGSFANGRQIACLCSSADSPADKDNKDDDCKSSKQAILVLEKLPISESEVSELLDSANEPDSLSLILANDVYYTYNLKPGQSSKLNTLKATLVNPATEQHISKYTYSEVAVVTETPASYAAVTKPYVLERQLAVRWVHNILDGTAEAERVLYSDPDPVNGFVLLPDMKWDGVSDPSRRLYLMAIVRRRDLLSLRDLTTEHLPLLERIEQFVPKFLAEKYNISANSLRIFFHYLPSYWHLHIHFVVGGFASEESGGTALGGLWSAERAHWLSCVIANIRMQPDFYQKATLLYTLRKDNPLMGRHNSYTDKISKEQNGDNANGHSHSTDEPVAKAMRLESN